MGQLLVPLFKAKVILSLLLAIFIAMPSAIGAEKEYSQLNQEWVEKLTRVNSSAETKSCCGQDQLETLAGKETPKSVGSCPFPLMSLVKDDPKSSLLGLLPSFEKSCSTLIQGKLDVHPKDLMSFIQSRGVQPGLKYNWHLDQQDIANLQNCTDVLPPREANLTVSKSLYLNNKLNLASEAHLSEIAAIESLFEERKLPKMCSQLATTFLQKRCSQYGLSCGKQNLDQLVEITEKLFTETKMIEKELQRTKDIVKKTELNHRLKTLYSIAPWINGKRFNRLKISGVSTKVAIQSQLLETRDLLLEDVQAFTTAQRCVNREKAKGCNPKELRKKIAKALFVSDDNSIEKSDLKSRLNLATHSLGSYESCLLDGKLEQDKASEVIMGAGISAAISLATIGGGAIIAAAKSSMLVKDLAQIGVVGIQSHLFVTDMENTVKSCLHKAMGISKDYRQMPLATQVKCTPIAANLSQALEYEGCFQNGLMAAMSVASLGVAKAQVLRETKMQRLSEWEPGSEADIKRYFYVHQLEVRNNAKTLVSQNHEIFSEVAPKHLKTLKSHDLEKFLSFRSLSTQYHYKGVPKEIIDGLADSTKYRDLISADGKFVELSVSKSLYLLWGSSPQSLSEKIKTASTAKEKLHWESILKLRNHVVAAMAEIDDKIMGSVYAQIKSPRGRVEMRLIELLSDLTARSGNPITKTEMGRPISKASEFLQRMGREGITAKISDAASPSEVAEAKMLVNELGVEQIQRMADSLETSYKSAGMPNSFKTTVLAMLFEKRKAN